jgi:hypothetical protein
VLAQIHQQASISISMSPSPTQTLSVQFTDIGHDHGLRRSLQLASRSTVMSYALGAPQVQCFVESEEQEVHEGRAGVLPGDARAGLDAG